MPNEFERFLGIFNSEKAKNNSQRQLELDRENESSRQVDEERRNIEETIRIESIKNKKIFDNSGVTALFQKIIDEKIVTWNENGEPARLEWGFKNQWLTINYRYEVTPYDGYDNVEETKCGNQSLTLYALENGRIGRVIDDDDEKRKPLRMKYTYLTNGWIDITKTTIKNKKDYPDYPYIAISDIPGYVAMQLQ